MNPRSSIAMDQEVAEYFELGAQVHPGDTVFDVGANIGAFSALAARRTGGRIRVHAFEPSPLTFRVLEHTFATDITLRRAETWLHRTALTQPSSAGRTLPFYHFTRFPTDSTYDLPSKQDEVRALVRAYGDTLRSMASHVPVIRYALHTAIDRTLHVLCRPDIELGAWLADRIMGTEVVECNTETLDSVRARYEVDRIDLLKIDVEGAELDVLRGCQASLGVVRQVAVETTTKNGTAAEIAQLLHARGFSEQISARPADSADGLSNLLIVARRPESP